MKNIVVTGGLGFVGSHVVVELANNGFRPVVIDDCSNSDISVLTKLQAICGFAPLYFDVDVRDSSSLAAIFDDLRPEAVVHCAAKKYVSESIADPLSYYNNNIGGITSLLDVMQRFDCDYFIFSSSACVYGETSVLPVVEDVCEGGMAIMPMIGRAHMLRMWGGIMDMSMDGSPFIDKTGIDGLYFNGGWCYGGVKATPGSGHAFAAHIAKGEPTELTAPFALSRFETGFLIDEHGAAAVAH